jgi:hypothetical protein
MTPFGPLLYGVPWLSFLFVAIIIALLLTALTPPAERFTEREGRLETKGRRRTDADTMVAMDVFFWVLMLGLVAAIVAAYV